MDVHDCGRADKRRPLEPGMVITVEPGLYIPHNRPNVDREWWGTAVRWVKASYSSGTLAGYLLFMSYSGLRMTF